MHSIKCVAVGDSSVGKASLLITYTTNQFPKYIVPMLLLDKLGATSKIGNQSYALNLYHTPGLEDYDQVRQQYWYPGTDVFLVCFSVTDLASLENVKDKWIPELKRYCPGTPFVLVGTMVDRRENFGKVAKPKMFTKTHGQELAKQLKAFRYVECSAMSRVGLQDVFDAATLATLNDRQPKKICRIS